MTQNDTIAALATAVGGAVAVLRISGGAALDIVLRACGQRPGLIRPPFRQLRLANVYAANGEITDQALVVCMPGPDSFTGEDMAEIHCHGGSLAARTVLQRVCECGARQAEPGEFSRRAFLNGKLDLTQAEAIADLIQAQTAMALRVATRQLNGNLGAKIRDIYSGVEEILAELESRLDFPDEHLDWLEPEELEARYTDLLSQCRRLRESERTGEILRHGLHVVLAGAPNVGKSSLLNAILGRERAIVTHIPGTTRDTLEEFVQIRGIPVRLVDTAGMRDSADHLENLGIERSRASLNEAQLILWVFDAAQPHQEQMPPELASVNVPLIMVGNKADLLPDFPGSEAVGTVSGRPLIYTCAVTGRGLESLFSAIEHEALQSCSDTEPEVAVSARHATLLNEAAEELELAAANAAAAAWELAAINLRAAMAAVGRITGQTAEPDLLHTIFSRFCIGK